jgi:hypothetical protein
MACQPEDSFLGYMKIGLSSESKQALGRWPNKSVRSFLSTPSA